MLPLLLFTDALALCVVVIVVLNTHITRVAPEPNSPAASAFVVSVFWLLVSAVFIAGWVVMTWWAS